MPYAVLGVVSFILLTAGTYAWDYTNSPVFCGTTCHTMPPEYAAYQVSPHARVDCVDCHIGKGFVATRISRKAGDIKHVTALAFRTYEYPIYAGELRPARDTCERCHYPSKFSDDSLRQNVHYLDDEQNTRISIYLALRTGGGSSREGLGRGIHWHVENQVYYRSTDKLDQNIPVVRVINSDGMENVYTALDTELSADELEALPEQRIDCITCHNRITHNILSPANAVDGALSRRQIDASIPFIRREAVRVLSEKYETDEEAQAAIQNLSDYYETEFPEFFQDNEERIQKAITTLGIIYADTVFRDQEIDWETHPNNLGHEEWPGCFRCHDGQHINEAGDAIRLECNLCHSIPEVVGPGVIEPMLPLATGQQPESHFDTHWIALHNQSIDQTCQACHTVENAGGVDNSSFCSNSACHGTGWEFAQLDAPGLAELLDQQRQATLDENEGVLPGAVQELPTEEEEPQQGDTPVTSVSDPTFADVEPLFKQRCLACHGATVATGGLVLETYNSVMQGGTDGPVILPGDAEDSELIKRQRDGHFASFTPDELQLVIDWINNGAPEN
jgi:nitrate/TMAO reductase-like tetraheme cytochrome c subunit